MRARYKFGLKLSDHGLFDAEKRRVLEAGTEQEIFDYLQIAWKEPEQRDSFDAMEPKHETLEAGEVEFESKTDFFADQDSHIWVK